MKTIRITCEGADIATLEEIHSLQGDLKSLSDEKYQKLKRALVKYGFSFPLFVWNHKDKLFTLDGHQRDRALKRMKEEGFRIPRLPIAYIHAKNEREAREKILLVSSQYGEMTEVRLDEFLKVGGLDFKKMKEMIDLLQIDIKDFEYWQTAAKKAE